MTFNPKQSPKDLIEELGKKARECLLPEGIWRSRSIQAYLQERWEWERKLEVREISYQLGDGPLIPVQAPEGPSGVTPEQTKRDAADTPPHAALAEAEDTIKALRHELKDALVTHLTAWYACREATTNSNPEGVVLARQFLLTSPSEGATKDRIQRLHGELQGGAPSIYRSMLETQHEIGQRAIDDLLAVGAELIRKREISDSALRTALNHHLRARQVICSLRNAHLRDKVTAEQIDMADEFLRDSPTSTDTITMLDRIELRAPSRDERACTGPAGSSSCA